MKTIKKILASICLPGYFTYQIFKHGIPKYPSFDYYIDYFSLAWECQKAKLEIKFGLCKTYTFEELKKELLK